MKRCGNEREGKVCILPEGPHPDHSDGREIWVDAEVTAQVARAPRRREATKGRTPRPTAASVDRITEMGRRARPETHVNPLRDGRRPFNGMSQSEGMEAAAASQTSEQFRTTFFLAMAEVATRQDMLSTNDAWDLLEARGFTRNQHAQAAGTVGRSGASIGLWVATEDKTLNTSGNIHSADDGVRVYRSLVVGQDFAEVIAPKVIAKAAARQRR